MVAAFTLGEQNLHDQAGTPTRFADVMLYCEAIPPTIRGRVRSWVNDHQRVIVCKDQRDLVLVLSRDFRVTDKQYFLAHKGIAKVTPHRGVFVVKTVHKPTGRKVAIVLEHRINSWWKDERGERSVRANLWHKHTDMTLEVIRVLKQENFTIFAGGDLNTPPYVRGYGGALVEERDALDRIACSRDAALSGFERLSPMGSDHHRIRATAHL